MSQWDLCRSLTTSCTRHPSRIRLLCADPVWGLPLRGGSPPPQPTLSVHQPSSPLMPRQHEELRSGLHTCMFFSGLPGLGCPSHDALLLVLPGFSLQSSDSPAPTLLCCGVDCEAGLCCKCCLFLYLLPFCLEFECGFTSHVWV